MYETEDPTIMVFLIHWWLHENRNTDTTVLARQWNTLQYILTQLKEKTVIDDDYAFGPPRR